MRVPALPTALAFLLFGEVAFAANEWSSPYIVTPLKYTELSFAKRQVTLDRRRVWDDLGQLTSRQATCSPGFSECPSGQYCHAAGSFCCSTDESQACPTGATCCSDPGNAANVTGCASAGSTCCGASGQCETGHQCCTGPDGPPGCALASNTCCGAKAQCTDEQQCCGVFGGESLGCAPKDATCCTLNNWCLAGASCCSDEDGTKYCSPVCCGQGVSCQVGDKCCMGNDGERFCAASCEKTAPVTTPTPKPQESKSSGLGIGPIVGIAVGGIAVLALIAALIILRCRHNSTHDKPPPAVAFNAGHQPGMVQATPYDPKTGGPPNGAYGATPTLLAGAHGQQQFQQPTPQPYANGNGYQHHGMPVAAAAPHHQYNHAALPAHYDPYGPDRPLSAHSQIPQFSPSTNALAISTTSGPTPPQSPLLSDYSPHHRPSASLSTVAAPPSGAGSSVAQAPQRYGSPGASTTSAITPYGVPAPNDKETRETMYTAPVHRPSHSYGGSSSSTPGPSVVDPMSPGLAGQELPPPLYSERSAR